MLVPGNITAAKCSKKVKLSVTSLNIFPLGTSSCIFGMIGAIQICAVGGSALRWVVTCIGPITTSQHSYPRKLAGKHNTANLWTSSCRCLLLYNLLGDTISSSNNTNRRTKTNSICSNNHLLPTAVPVYTMTNLGVHYRRHHRLR